MFITATIALQSRDYMGGMTRVRIGFVTVIVILVVNGFFFYRAAMSLQNSSLQMAQSRETSRAARTLLIALVDAETGQRGYLITGDERYLEPYKNSLKNIHSLMSELKDLTADNANQRDYIFTLEKTIPDKINDLEKKIEIQKKQGQEVARQIVLSDEGKKKMDEIRALISDIDLIATTDLRKWDEQVRTSGRQFNIAILISSFSALLLLSLIYVVTIRYFRERVEKEKVLTEANALLESRVNERTKLLAETNEQLYEEIQERKQTGEKLQKFTVDLERSNSALQDFAFVASHDLQEPLRIIQGFSGRIQSKFSENLPPEGNDFLRRIQKAAKRMEGLILDLLAYSRLTTKSQPFVSTNLHTIAQEVLDDLEETINRTNGRVVLADLPTIDADPLQMRQMIQNLVANALKFHKANVPPIVVINSRIIDKESEEHNTREKEFCEITIKDNGIGFDEKYLERIFQPFQRLHSQQDYEGTGMGLAVCRKIVERHDGEITAQSISGQGTTFIVTLPTTQINEVTTSE